METPIKYEIMAAMLKYLTNASADQYGQLKTMDVYAVFGNRTKEFLEYLKKDPFIQVSTYGDRYGAYQGIGGLYDIKDENFRMMCRETWAKNESVSRNMNQW